MPATSPGVGADAEALHGGAEGAGLISSVVSSRGASYASRSNRLSPKHAGQPVGADIGSAEPEVTCCYAVREAAANRLRQPSRSQRYRSVDRNAVIINPLLDSYQLADRLLDLQSPAITRSSRSA